MLQNHGIYDAKRIHKYIPFVIFINIVYSIPTKLPFGSIVGYCIGFITIILFTSVNWKKRIIIYLHYEIYSLIFSYIGIALHSIMLWDFGQFSDINTLNYYVQCKSLTVTALSYIFYVIYTNTKNMKKFHSHYQYAFNALLLVTVIILSYLTLYICKNDTTNSFVIPLLFSTIFMLIMLIIHLYQKFVTLLETQMKDEIQLKTYQQALQYQTQIDENLKLIKSIRHDMKNHLIIIDGYISQKKPVKAHEYIMRISENTNNTQLIDTGDSMISALLNCKHNEAELQNIKCDFTCQFPFIHVGDYEISTILGNLLDNAILAAGKCNPGWVHFSMIQKDSLLEIVIQNNHQENIQEKDGVILSTKEFYSASNLFHGIGISNVRTQVEKINGTIDISYTLNEFSVIVYFPNY